MKGSFHECYLDREARYWDVPQALSVDVASQGAPGGLRYRLGVHHSAGVPVECGSEERARKIPLGALPGMRVQAAASLEKVLDIWKGNRSFRLQKSYSLLRTRPHISLSGIVGKCTTPTFLPLVCNVFYSLNLPLVSELCPVQFVYSCVFRGIALI